MIRILLADDHTVVRESLATTLRNSGDCLVVAEAGDGISAIEQAIAVQPDVAIVDISMPLSAFQTSGGRRSPPSNDEPGLNSDCSRRRRIVATCWCG